MMSERVGKWCRRFEWCILNAKIGWSSNKFKKHWSARVTDEFSSETLILRRRLYRLYTRCVQFSPWPSLLFCTCYAGEMMIPWRCVQFSLWPSLLFCTCYAGEMMIPCQVPTFPEFILRWFSISPSFSSLNKSINDWKIANDVRKYWKLMTSLWMVRTERKKSGDVIS